MEGQSQSSHRQERHFPWLRALIAFLVSLLVSVAAILLILSTEHVIAAYWLVIIPIALAALGQLVPLYQYLLPISPETKDNPPPSPPTPIEIKVSMSPPTNEATTHKDHTTQPVNLWNIPYHRNPYFTGREYVLTALHERLNIAKTTALTQSQALSGLGGIGKTLIAVEYAYRHRDEYRYVLWVNAENRETIIKSYLELATLLDLPEKQEPDQNKVVAEVTHWFTEHHQWLLIFDNADDLTLAEEFLPTSDTGHLLLTTRNQALGTLAESLDIKIMDKQEGTLLILRRAKLLAIDAPLEQANAAERTQAERIFESMDGLPLALDQAAAYIEETQCRLTAFLAIYERKRDEILQRRGGTSKEHPLPVAITWSLSFSQVQHLNPAAADLLRVCAFLATDAIPEELFVEGAMKLGHLLAICKNDAMQLNEAIGILIRYSLVRRDRDEQTFSLHRLVQAALQIAMDMPLKKMWAKRVVSAVNEAFPNPVDVSTWPQCERYLSHALKCATLVETYRFKSRQAARLLEVVAVYLYKRGQYEQAEPLYQRALAISEQANGPKAPATATTLNSLAELYRSQGKYAQVEPLLQRALAIYEQALGPNNYLIAGSLNNLADFYRSQGKYAEAESLYRRALAIHEQALGPTHPNIAGNLNNLARIYQRQGKYAEAELLYQRALAIREQALGPTHPHTASVLNNLAELYRVQGKNAQAEPLLQHALAIMEKMFGPTHPNTKTVRANHTALLEEMKHTKK